jgi:uncharacterized protein (DUF1778 family)
MKAKKSVLLWVDPKELALVKKAAQSERRSMAQFFVIAGLGAAKATLARQASTELIPLGRRADDKSEASV